MKVGTVQRLLVVAMICVATALAWADEPLNSDATREYILDDVPNFPTILKDQWSNRVPTTSFDGGRSNYGLLSEDMPNRQVTLAESIALALEHNTGRRIQALNPIAAMRRPVLCSSARAMLSARVIWRSASVSDNRP